MPFYSLPKPDRVKLVEQINSDILEELKQNTLTKTKTILRMRTRTSAKRHT